MYCKKCGTQLKTGDKYCPKCGTQIVSSKETKLQPKLFIILFICFILLICTILIFRYNSNKNNLLQISDYTFNIDHLSQTEVYAVQALNQYVDEGGDESKIGDSVWIMKTYGGTNGVLYYIEVVDGVLYAIRDDGEISEYTTAEAGGEKMMGFLIYAVEYDGQYVSLTEISE